MCVQFILVRIYYKRHKNKGFLDEIKLKIFVTGLYS
jgi:hypothetical protein